jgi:hypothetical protein
MCLFGILHGRKLWAEDFVFLLTYTTVRISFLCYFLNTLSLTVISMVV